MAGMMTFPLAVLAMLLIPEQVFSNPTPLPIARDFLDALVRRDGTRLKKHLSKKAVLQAGDIAVPVRGVESDLLRRELLGCTVTDVNVLKDVYGMADEKNWRFDSEGRDGSITVRGHLSCQEKKSARKASSIDLTFNNGRVVLISIL